MSKFKKAAMNAKKKFKGGKPPFGDDMDNFEPMKKGSKPDGKKKGGFKGAKKKAFGKDEGKGNPFEKRG